MKMSAEIDKLMTALSKAQSEIEGAKKDSQNPFFKSSYADLMSVWMACQAPLTKNGLAVTQCISVVDGQHYLCSILGHCSGQFIESVMMLQETKTAQDMGKTITYYRRYMLAALVGVCPEDDDGETANKSMVDNKKTESKKPDTVEPKQPSPPAEPIEEAISAEEMQEVERLISEEDKQYREDLLKYYTNARKLQKPMTNFQGFPKRSLPGLMKSISKRKDERNKKASPKPESEDLPF